jgi:hypothetical protein
MIFSSYWEKVNGYLVRLAFYGSRVKERKIIFLSVCN